MGWGQDKEWGQGTLSIDYIIYALSHERFVDELQYNIDRFIDDGECSSKSSCDRYVIAVGTVHSGGLFQDREVF